MGCIALQVQSNEDVYMGWLTSLTEQKRAYVWNDDGVVLLKDVQPEYDNERGLAWVVLPWEKVKYSHVIIGVLWAKDRYDWRAIRSYVVNPNCVRYTYPGESIKQKSRGRYVRC
jgi:hypothetical protein